MNNTLKIKVTIDTRKALLKGSVLRLHEELEVSQEMFTPPEWVALVTSLDMTKEPYAASQPIKKVGHGEPTTSLRPLTELTTEDLILAINEAIIAAAEAHQRCEDLAAERELRDEAEVAALEAAQTPAISPLQVHGKTFDRMLLITRDFALMSQARRVRALEARDRLNALATAHNEVVDAAIAAHREAADALAAKEAAALKKAEATRLLETGFFEKKTDSYNAKRYGAPWCAAVTFKEGKISPEYDFTAGESTGKWGAAGIIRIAVKPGDMFAIGQKDLRNPIGSENQIYVVKSDGTVKGLSRAAALREFESPGG